MTPEHAEHDHLGHERKLAEALGALVQQADLSDYRDSLGHPLATTSPSGMPRPSSRRLG